jgi:hypothetical protein
VPLIAPDTTRTASLGKAGKFAGREFAKIRVPDMTFLLLLPDSGPTSAIFSHISLFI